MESLQLFFCDFGRNAILQTHDGGNPPLVLRVLSKCKPSAVVGPPSEAGWHHSDNCEELVIEQQSFAQRGRTAVEEPAPSLIGENDDGISFTIRRHVGR